MFDILYIFPISFIIVMEGVIKIHIELKKPNRFKDMLHKIGSKLEDMMFSILLKLPERMIPSFLMNQIEKYINKQISKTKQEIIKDRWKQVALNEVLDKTNHK